MPMTRTWNGMTIQHKIDRAAGRAIVAIGMNAAVDTKRITHRISGTLARSVHVAPAGEEHDDVQEERLAANSDLLFERGIVHPSHFPAGPAVEVGSWLPYACVEWVGRQHPGVTQGIEMTRGVRADAIVRQAFLEEGLL